MEWMHLRRVKAFLVRPGLRDLPATMALAILVALAALSLVRSVRAHDNNPPPANHTDNIARDGKPLPNSHVDKGTLENDNFDDIMSKKLPWRSIGPAIMGGRIDDFAVVESNPSTIYVGAATGGIWKTTNNGVTWHPIFDDQGTGSIGDIAIAPSNPNIVWVGSGEANNRQSSSWGDGVYRSLDAGKTWGNMGLKDTQAIGRVVIDPHDPDVVYVAAGGHLWGP
ncbi:MAG TPA: hypothetical protein VJX67_09050, partial [Blastocatellia bacterium]|nr:hypothetical protein [Blastocatellia bacterium]